MGILSYIKGGDDAKSIEDGIPLRNKREKCWEARDNFNNCLDLNKIENPLDPKNTKLIKDACDQQDIKFKENCANSWVKYFKEKRFVDIKREKMMKQVELENAKLINVNR